MHEAEMERRLALASSLLGWGPARIAAFRDGHASGAPDAARMGRHVHDHGYEEAGLAPDLLDSLAYRDGVEARSAAGIDPVRLGGDRDALAGEAALWADQAESGLDPEDADWLFDPEGATDILLEVMSREEWAEWLRAEHRTAVEDGRPGYGHLLVQDILQPAVLTRLHDGTVEIWDGWHRAAATVVRGGLAMPMLVGRERTPASTPR